MDAQDCLQMLREIQDVSFATVGEDGLPHNRIIDIMIVEVGIKSPNHMSFNDFTFLIKDAGNHDFSFHFALIDRIFEENPAMNDVYPGTARYILEAFAIESGSIEFFDLGTSPIRRESFSFGGSKTPEKGFRITDSCIGCGTCKRNCPQQCVEAGTPFRIRQDRCLHCGLCFENCPVQAVVRRDA